MKKCICGQEIYEDSMCWDCWEHVEGYADNNNEARGFLIGVIGISGAIIEIDQVESIRLMPEIERQFRERFCSETREEKRLILERAWAKLIREFPKISRASLHFENGPTPKTIAVCLKW